MFVHVLQHPDEESVESDIALMRVAAGHFNYLEYIIPELSFPMTRDLANLAQAAVYRARSGTEHTLDHITMLDTITNLQNIENLEQLSV